MESGVHFSLHENCHHQLIYEKINLKVFYRSPYKREIWHYQRANVDLIQQAIEQFSCENLFSTVADYYILSDSPLSQLEFMSYIKLRLR